MAISNIHVVAAIFENEVGEFLVAQRPADKTMAGAWEFPGGKLKVGESRLAGLTRELHEELGIHVGCARPFIRYTHNYPEVEVDLDVWRVEQWNGEIQACEGQVLRWCPPGDLAITGLLAADLPVLSALTLPDKILITPTNVSGGEEVLLEALEHAARPGLLICLRQPGLDARSLLELASRATCRLESTGARLLVHGDPSEMFPLVTALRSTLAPRLGETIAGVHVPSQFLYDALVLLRPDSALLGASCHNAAELEAAIRLGANYAFLGNVKETTSHPGRPGMGWERFENLIRNLPLPIYAIGGLSPADLETAWAAGAQGIAAIRGLCPG